MSTPNIRAILDMYRKDDKVVRHISMIEVPKGTGSAGSVLEFNKKVARNVGLIRIEAANGGLELNKYSTETYQMYNSLLAFFEPLDIDFAHVLISGGMSTMTKNLGKFDAILPTHLNKIDGKKAYPGQSFVDYLARVLDRMEGEEGQTYYPTLCAHLDTLAKKHTREAAIAAAESARQKAFEVAMTKNKTEEEAKEAADKAAKAAFKKTFFWETAPDIKTMVAMVIATRFLTEIGLVASVTVDRTLDMINSDIDALHHANTRDVAVAWIKSQLFGADVVFVMDGNSDLIEVINQDPELEAKYRIARCSGDKAVWIVYNTESVMIHEAFNPTGIRVAANKNHEYIAVVASLDGQMTLLVGGHNKSGDAPEDRVVQTQEITNFVRWVNGFLVEHPEIVQVIAGVDTNVYSDVMVSINPTSGEVETQIAPGNGYGGHDLPISLPGWNVYRTAPRNGAKERVDTDQIKKIELKLVNYDVIWFASRNPTAMLIGTHANDEPMVHLPNTECCSDHLPLEARIQMTIPV